MGDNVTSFKTSAEFESLRHQNQTMYYMIEILQKKNAELEALVKHLEEMLQHQITLINPDSGGE